MSDAPLAKPPSKLLTDYYGSLFFCLVLIFIGASFFVLKPKLDEVKTTNAQISTSLQQLQQNHEYLNSLEQSINAAQTIAPDVLHRVDQALPREQQIPQLLLLLSETADRDGVKLPSVSFSDTSLAVHSATSSITELGINLTATAQNYPQIKKYIRDLEVSLRLLDITGINVSISNASGKETAYSLQMKTYIYTPPASRPSTPAQR